MSTRKSREAREWIMFAVGIGIIIYFAASGIELSPTWLMLIGAMLGMGVLVAGAERAVGGIVGKRKTEEEGE